MIQNHIDSVVHHTVSMAAIVAKLSGKKKVDVSHLQGVKTYMASKCGSKSGGTSMPSDFYGYPHPAYAASNADAGVQASTIQWDKQVARPAQGPAQPQSGGGGKRRELSSLIRVLLKDMDVTASKAALVELEKIIESHVHCFLRDVRAVAPVTVKKLEKVLKKSAHVAFQ